ncbi:MAG: NIPSNAP family protein [Dehalococcoidia bacterium]|nr:NIPSNAP family protein [Dehalococcoidia bacterium]
MALAQVAQFRITPGKAQEFAANVAAAKKIHERLGAQVRVWNAIVGGPNSGIVSYVMEHKDWASFASFNEKLAADSEWQQFAANVLQRADPSGQFQGAVLANEMTP